MRLTRRRSAAALLAACSIAFAAGCGGDEADPTTAAAPATAPVTPVAPVTTAPAVTTPPVTTPPVTTPPVTTPPVTTPPVTTAPVTSSPSSPGRVVDTATFVQDVQAFAQTLTQFGLTLQAAAEGPEALRARSSLLRQQLDQFDAVAARMGGYTVDVPALESRRAAIVAASPDISRLGRELLDAAEAGDASRVQQIATQFTAALERLRDAATGG